MIPTGDIPTSSKHIIYAFAIILAVTAAYSGTIAFPFQFDDIAFIEGNPLVVNGTIDDADMEEGVSLGILYTRHTRLATYTTFRWNYLLDEYNTAGYHAINILIHIACALLVYLLAWFMAQSPAMSGSRVAEAAHEAALGAGLLFGLHPIQTQAVTYLSQRFTVLAAMFCLATALLYMLYRIRGRTAYLALATLTAALAMHTKENSFVMPLGIALMEFTLFEGRASRRIMGLAPLMATMAFVPIYRLIDVGPTISEATSIPHNIGRMNYLITSIAVVATYIRLLALPVNQVFDYDYPVYDSLANPAVGMALGLHAAIIALAVYMFRLGGAARLAGFAALWFYLMLSVENSVLPLENIIFEHRIYLPSAFIFIAFAYATCGLARNRSIALAFMLALSLTLGAAAYTRNHVWRDGLTMWADVVSKSPMKARALNNLCSEYKDAGDLENAEPHCLRAIEIDPAMTQAHLNLGEIYELSGRYAPAATEYETVLKDWPHVYMAAFRLGLLYSKLDMHGRSINAYIRALRAKPDYHEAYFNLGNAYAAMGRYKEAEEAFQRALRLNPGNERYAHNLDTVRQLVIENDK